VLVGAEVIDDPAASGAVDHVGIEAAGMSRLKGAEPGDSLAAERIAVGVILDGEGDVDAVLGKHDSPPGANVEKREGVEASVPDALHDAAADGGNVVGAAEPEASLDRRKQGWTEVDRK
jgi:hypothetical protein